MAAGPTTTLSANRPWHARTAAGRERNAAADRPAAWWREWRIPPPATSAAETAQPAVAAPPADWNSYQAPHLPDGQTLLNLPPHNERCQGASRRPSRPEIPLTQPS